MHKIRMVHDITKRFEPNFSMAQIGMTVFCHRKKIWCLRTTSIQACWHWPNVLGWVVARSISMVVVAGEWNVVF